MFKKNISRILSILEQENPIVPVPKYFHIATKIDSLKEYFLVKACNELLTIEDRLIRAEHTENQ